MPSLVLTEVNVSVVERVPLDDTATPVTTPAASHAIDNILRLALNGVAAARPQQTTALQGASRPQADFSKAADLLDRATSAIGTLTAQRDELEQTVGKLEDALIRQEELFSEKFARLQAEAAEWERRAKVVKEQLQEYDQRLSDQQTRMDALTERAETADRRAQQAEDLAGDAHRQVQMYHDRIMATLGNLI